MGDQSDRAGNIGDIIKHFFLPFLVWPWILKHGKNCFYLETHAGFYDYDFSLMKTKKEKKWKSERSWSLGPIVKALESGVDLGHYGSILKTELKKGEEGKYPGSIKLIEALLKEPNTGIRGFDLGTEEVESYGLSSANVCVQIKDGYAGVKAFHQKPRLIFCDPVWEKIDESKRVRELIKKETSVIVWYPIRPKTEEFREFLVQRKCQFVELKFGKFDYKLAGGGWASYDLPGAGLAFWGIPGITETQLEKHGNKLVEYFNGEIHESKKGNVLIVRKLDLELSLGNFD